jgi:LmbE family N-acetylglucosaminyl deacetylase
VDVNGLVTTLAVGSTVVTATCEGRTGTATLTTQPIPVATVTVALASASVFVGQTAQATATTRDAGGNVLTGRTVTWSSSNPAVGTVDVNGLVTTLAVGSTVVTATCEGRTGTATLTTQPIPVATVTVALASAGIIVGQTTQGTATTRDTGGNVLTGRTVTWSSSNPAVATVDGNGRVTALAVGSTVVTATCEGRTGSATLTVTPPPVHSVLVALDSVRVTVGSTTQARATTLDPWGNVLTGRRVTWGTSNGAVATVSGSGLVTTRGAGYVSITATSESITGSGTLSVASPGSKSRTILVIGPHPDDECLIAAGRARSAVNAGDVVKLVVVTNGDVEGHSSGLVREAESVASAVVLGLGEQDVIFLGYPDTILNDIYTAGSGTQVFTGPSGGTTTYGNRGLGGVDYHTYLTGSPGSYDRNTMRQDFEALIRNYRPDEIYTVTSYDTHPDHHAVALFVEDALTTLRQSGAISPTLLFQGIVWAPGDNTWPQVDPGGFTPTVPFEMPALLESWTPLRWADALKFAVPAEMLSTDPSVSVKYQAIRRYRSQVSSWLTSFARADEIFWLTTY